MGNIALVSVIHDPKGKNQNLFEKLQDKLEKIYSNLFITISEETSPKMKELLVRSPFITKIIPKRGAAHARREAVNLCLSGTNQFYHYCDFDRLLTWVDRHLNELKNLVSLVPNCDYLILGRTKRAFHTHPIEWIETEKITNKIFSLEFGQEVDITAGSCLFSRECAESINQYSMEKVTDAEWAMIIQRIAKRKVGYLPVEGLEFHEEINGVNNVMSQSESWIGRLRLSLLISETAMRTGNNG